MTKSKRKCCKICRYKITDRSPIQCRSLLPFPDLEKPQCTCNGIGLVAASTLSFRNVAGEGFIRINPTNCKKMASITDQDVFGGLPNSPRISHSEDGGKTWKPPNDPVNAPYGAPRFSACLGSKPINGGPVDAGDPVLEYFGNGKLLAGCFRFGFPPFGGPPGTGLPNNRVALSVSVDNGVTWGQVIDTDPLDVDYEKLIRDPNVDNVIYVFYSSGAFGGAFDGIKFFKVTVADDNSLSFTDPKTVAGNTWQTPWPVIFPDSTLGVVDSAYPPINMVFYRSQRPGGEGDEPWDAFLFAEGQQFGDPRSAKSDAPFPPRIRDDNLWRAYVNPKNEYIYVVRSIRNSLSGSRSTMIIYMSKDRGETWTDGRIVNYKSTDRQAFMNDLIINDEGIVAVMFYDCRFDDPCDEEFSAADAWLSLFTPDLEPIQEIRLTKNSMNLLNYPYFTLGSSSVWIGDYLNGTNDGNDFLVLINRANNDAPIAPTPFNIPPGKIVYDTADGKVRTFHEFIRVSKNPCYKGDCNKPSALVIDASNLSDSEDENEEREASERKAYKEMSEQWLSRQ